MTTETSLQNPSLDANTLITGYSPCIDDLPMDQKGEMDCFVLPDQITELGSLYENSLQIQNLNIQRTTDNIEKLDSVASILDKRFEVLSQSESKFYEFLMTKDQKLDALHVHLSEWQEKLIEKEKLIAKQSAKTKMMQKSLDTSLDTLNKHIQHMQQLYYETSKSQSEKNETSIFCNEGTQTDKVETRDQKTNTQSKHMISISCETYPIETRDISSTTTILQTSDKETVTDKNYESFVVIDNNEIIIDKEDKRTRKRKKVI